VSRYSMDLRSLSIRYAGPVLWTDRCHLVLFLSGTLMASVPMDDPYAGKLIECMPLIYPTVPG
jgi:hypothetical protein